MILQTLKDQSRDASLAKNQSWRKTLISVVYEYEFKQGDHWVVGVLKALETIEKGGHECSPEFYVLLGLAKGIQLGFITQGNATYTDIALKATVDGSSTEIRDVVHELGRFGLFAAGPLGGSKGRQILEKTRAEEPAFDFTDPYNLPSHWKGDLADMLWRCHSGGAIPELNVLHGILSSVENDLLRYGEPRIGGLLLEASRRAEDSRLFSEALEQFATFGFFGNEILPGCQPERISAVDRVR